MLPDLPFEVQRRIIHFTLALPPSVPQEVTRNSPITPEWDSLAGQNGRRARLWRTIQRLEVQRTALSLMKVCKAWKPLAAKHLYTEPVLTSHNVLPFALALLAGDRKWSDLNLHPHSTPGRYVRTLDLCHIMSGIETPHMVHLAKACKTIISLTPCLTHLVLPPPSILPLSAVAEAPNAPMLKALENLVLDTAQTSNEAVAAALSALLELEMLGLVGEGQAALADAAQWTPTAFIPISLPRLHTVILDGVTRSDLLQQLAEASLPALSRVLITPDDESPDQSAFFASHAHQLLSLTFLPSREFPPRRPTPPGDVLYTFSSLRHLAVLFAVPLEELLQAPRGHPLQALTVAKPGARHATPSPVPHAHHVHHRVVEVDDLPKLLGRTSADLKILSVDGYTWLTSELGAAALDTGLSGRMRRLGASLRALGVEMRDMDGTKAPDMPELSRRGRSGSRTGASVGSPTSPKMGSYMRLGLRVDEEDEEDGS